MAVYFNEHQVTHFYTVPWLLLLHNNSNSCTTSQLGNGLNSWIHGFSSPYFMCKTNFLKHQNTREQLKLNISFILQRLLYNYGYCRQLFIVFLFHYVERCGYGNIFKIKKHCCLIKKKKLRNTENVFSLYSNTKSVALYQLHGLIFVHCIGLQGYKVEKQN